MNDTTETDCKRHTKFDGSYWVNDARGIPVARVCGKCKAMRLAKYRPDIFVNSDYSTDGEHLESDY
jgi:hypothetical protein